MTPELRSALDALLAAHRAYGGLGDYTAEQQALGRVVREWERLRTDERKEKGHAAE